MFEIFYNLSGYNSKLFLLINNHTNISILPNILYIISSIFFIANFAIFYIIVCVYFYYKTKNDKNPSKYFTSIYYELTRIGICYTLFGLTFAALKFSVNLTRPFCTFDTINFITIANTESERCLSSFPSAHTGLAIFATYCLWPYMNKICKIFMCCVIILVALSRITLAMHYPTDIIYSAVVTILVIITGNYINKLLEKVIITPIKKFIIRNIL